MEGLRPYVGVLAANQRAYNNALTTQLTQRAPGDCRITMVRTYADANLARTQLAGCNLLSVNPQASGGVGKKSLFLQFGNRAGYVK